MIKFSDGALAHDVGNYRCNLQHLKEKGCGGVGGMLLLAPTF